MFVLTVNQTIDQRTLKMNPYEQIPDIQCRRAVFLYDTLTHYNSDNRSFRVNADKGGPLCLYFPENPSSKGCAIGRHLDPELAKSFEKLGSVHNDYIFDLLPDWMKEMGQYFLVRVQSLHDNEQFWNKSGFIYNEAALKLLTTTIQTFRLNDYFQSENGKIQLIN